MSTKAAKGGRNTLHGRKMASLINKISKKEKKFN
jgi:hypothetical protein